MCVYEGGVRRVSGVCVVCVCVRGGCVNVHGMTDQASG